MQVRLPVLGLLVAAFAALCINGALASRDLPTSGVAASDVATTAVTNEAGRKLLQVNCPNVAGYVLTVGQDHGGDDIGCYGGTDFNTAASACNSNPSCKAFNVLPNNGFYCIKVASSPLASASNVCFYTKITVSCPNIAGYSTTVGADHGGDDIGCYGGTDFNTAASACNSNPSCKAFNVLPNNGFYCIKVASSPLTGAANVCFYTKNPALSCPSVAGYSTTVGQDHNGDDIGCYGGTDFNTAASACNSNPSCKAFNVLPNNGFYCIKVASSPLASASNVCFYTKNTATGGGGTGVTSVVSEATFKQLLPLIYSSDAGACSGAGIMTYQNFVTAASSFYNAGFLNNGDATINKRELAAFLAQASQETNGGGANPGDWYYLQGGLCMIFEGGGAASANCSISYCSGDPCPQPTAGYCGRGPLQLSYNYNYGPAGQALGLDLLNNPKLVSTDGVTSFRTSLWFWMTPQSPKPSCHAAITSSGWLAGRPTGYGLVTNIVNGAVLQCGSGVTSPAEQMKIGYYKRYCDILGVSYGDNVDCSNQASF